MTLASSTTTAATNHKMKSSSKSIRVKAKSRFLERVSHGIKALQEHYGYSRDRASSLILKEIQRTAETSTTKNSPQSSSSSCDLQVVTPQDHEVFKTMGNLGLGLDDALQVQTISNSIQQIQVQQNLDSLNAIEYLSSSLTVMKLLASVEQQPGTSSESGFIVTAATMEEEKETEKTRQLTPSSSSTTKAETADSTANTTAKELKQPVSSMQSSPSISPSETTASKQSNTNTKKSRKRQNPIHNNNNNTPNKNNINKDAIQVKVQQSRNSTSNTITTATSSIVKSPSSSSSRRSCSKRTSKQMVNVQNDEDVVGEECRNESSERKRPRLDSIEMP